jgi:putative hydrolase of the HAD superfamily
MTDLYPEPGRPPRALLLDVGFTLTFYDGERIAASAALAGVPADATAIESTERALRTEIRELQGVPLRTHDDGGRRWLRTVFRRILELSGTPGAPEDLDRAAESVFRDHMTSNVWRRVGPGVAEALARLRDASILLGVVSNSEGTIEAMLEDVGLRRYFDAVIDSTVVGVSKPDPRIFRLALERLGVAPSDAIMVGDSPTGDITGARAAGVPAALLDPFELYPWVDAPKFRDVPAFTDWILRS